jgi:hypothetical protein
MVWHLKVVEMHTQADWKGVIIIIIIHIIIMVRHQAYGGVGSGMLTCMGSKGG